MIHTLLPGDEAIGVQYRHQTVGLDGFELDFHSHIEYEIYYFHSGKCHYFINDKIYDLQPGDMIIMHGLTLHRPNPDMNVPYERTKIHFRPYYIENLVNQLFGIHLLSPFKRLKNTRINLKNRESELDSLFRKIDFCYRYRAEPIYDTRLRVFLLELLTYIYQFCADRVIERDVSSSSKVVNTQKIIDFVEHYYTESGLSLNRIAEETYFSKYYISRVFKEVTGAGVMDFVTIKKIELAKRMLLQGKSVTETGFEVGFKHPAHFSRTFKQKVGMTAETYKERNQHLQEEFVRV